MPTEYTISQAQLNTLLDASKPTIAISGSDGYMGSSPQDNANVAWRRLGDEMGFDWKTVRPIAGSCDKHFTAEPR